MKITASINHDYILNPKYGEMHQFRKKFGRLAIQTESGFTLSSYFLHSSMLVKDMKYKIGEKSFIAKKTECFNNVTSAMRKLGLTVSIETGKFLEHKKGLINYYASFLEYSELGFKVRKLPQIDSIYFLNGGDKMVILGINGEYDLTTEIFSGSLDVVSYENYMRLKK